MSAPASSSRPAVKRQYGSRNKATATPSRASTSASTSSSSTTSSSRLHSSTLALPSSDWDLLTSDDSLPPAPAAILSTTPTSTTLSSTPPTSPEPSTSAKGKQPELLLSPKRERRAPTGAKQKEAATRGDLRSFFAKVSPPRKKRARVDLSEEEEEGKGKGKRSAQPKPPTKPSKLEQLYLDPFETTGHATLSCTTCSLSYARTPEDMNFHARHHKKVVGGCEWIASDVGVQGVTVVDEGVEWGSKTGGKVVMVEAGVEGVVGRKVKDILSTIDTELSATGLTAEQLVECKLFLFVTPQRKVVAAAVVQRIEQAYEVVLSASATSSSPSSKPDPSLLRFGESEGAIFCSPNPLPTLLGIHRIWTSTPHRRCHLASTLLDCMASRYIYGCPIGRERRKWDVAFSQPTGEGRKLARGWTGTEGFRVFVE